MKSFKNNKRAKRIALDLFSNMLGQVTDYILSNGRDPDEIQVFVEDTCYSTLITKHLEEMANLYGISFSYSNIDNENIIYTFTFKTRKNIINLNDYGTIKK